MSTLRSNDNTEKTTEDMSPLTRQRTLIGTFKTPLKPSTSNDAVNTRPTAKLSPTNSTEKTHTWKSYIATPTGMYQKNSLG